MVMSFTFKLTQVLWVYLLYRKRLVLTIEVKIAKPWNWLKLSQVIRQ